MNLVKSAAERKRFLKFGTVGILGSVVDFGVFNLLTVAFKLPALPSSVVSFLLAVVNNFILNRYWTFPESKASPIAKQLIQFSVVSLIGLLIRTPLFAYMEKLLIPLAEKTVPNLLTPTIVGHNASLAVAIGVVLLWNYFANRFWTFKSISI
jgi:putative flippase GtrA